MANKTENYQLTKPLVSEFYDVEVQNSNMDKIDARMKVNADAIQELQGDSETKISVHNHDATAHPSIQVRLADIDSRLKTMELKYGTNVTGNSFEVTFASLEGLVVTGVWNEEYARVEF